MPLFTYKATNDDNKEVTGSLEAADESAAKQSLAALNLEVIELKEASRAKQQPVAASPVAQPQSFAFEGTDATGTVRRGTVQAPTKKDAFQHLRTDQKLTLTMLSPVGVLPQFKDPDLENWQKAKAPPPLKQVGFTNVPPSPAAPKSAPAAPAPAHAYAPLSSTLRLYAGWLLAWYGIFVALGYYATVRTLPFDIPFVRAFYVSPLILSFIIAIFLFLLLSGVHRRMKGRLISGIALALLGTGLFVVLMFLR